MHCGTESIFERSLLLSNEIDKAVNAKWNQNMLSFKFKMVEYIRENSGLAFILYLKTWEIGKGSKKLSFLNCYSN